jgi:hypothetical protein
VKGAQEVFLVVWRSDEHATQHNPFLEIDGLATCAHIHAISYPNQLEDTVSRLTVCICDEQIFVQFLVTGGDAQQCESLRSHRT